MVIVPFKPINLIELLLSRSISHKFLHLCLLYQILQIVLLGHLLILIILLAYLLNRSWQLMQCHLESLHIGIPQVEGHSHRRRVLLLLLLLLLTLGH